MFGLGFISDSFAISESITFMARFPNTISMSSWLERLAISFGNFFFFFGV